VKRHPLQQLRNLLLLFVVVPLGHTIASAQTVVNDSSDAPIKDGISMKIVLHQVPPEYPYEARRSGIIGHGILFGQVDYKTGIVTSVRMEKSTGNTILDQAALNAFRQWRFKPGTIRQFRTPIKYEMARSREEAMERIRRLQAADAQRKK
jgi:TonB family protein